MIETNQAKWWGWGRQGSQYDLSQRPKLWPWIQRKLSVENDLRLESEVPALCKLIEPLFNRPFLERLKAQLPAQRIFSTPLERITHAYGKSFRDLQRLKMGEVERAPDCVIYPQSHEEVELIVATAKTFGVVLIPFGGGTNIVGAVESQGEGSRMVVSVDMRRMNRLLDLDATSNVATFEAGVLGPHLEAQLAQHGFSLGHTPDSFEFSSLGGWLATRSAGTQSNAYGKVEDMVVALRMVTGQGTLSTALVPAASAGPNLNQVVAGSEGVLGIITEACMRVHRRPECEEYRGVLFPNFAKGVEAIWEVLERDCLPDVVRLSDEEETDLAFHMKPLEQGFAKLMKAPIKWYLGKRGYTRPCLMIMGFEGARTEVFRKRQEAMRIFRAHAGFDLGTHPGSSWKKTRFDLPYLRDLLLQNNIMADVAETSTVWSNVASLYQTVRTEILWALADAGYPGYVGCHVSHVYKTGVCLYFTFAAKQKLGSEIAQYEQVKARATAAIVHAGGALSHHHAVGYEHRPWFVDSVGATGIQAIRGVKLALDPTNMFNPGNLLPTSLISESKSKSSAV